MSPVPRRRQGARRSSRPTAGVLAAEERRLRAEQPLDALTARLGRLAAGADGLAAEAVMAWVLDVVGDRGPDADEMVARFCRAVVNDDRAVASPLALQALALVGVHGHADVRAEARAMVAGVDDASRAALPAWVASVGRAHVVEIGALRTADGAETVLHVMLDHDDRAAGPRHLVSAAVSHREQRVHLLDVRARADGDVLAPMAQQYVGSLDPVWSWARPDEIHGIVDEALVATAARTSQAWPVVGVDGASTHTWALGVHRLRAAAAAVP